MDGVKMILDALDDEEFGLCMNLHCAQSYGCRVGDYFMRKRDFERSDLVDLMSVNERKYYKYMRVGIVGRHYYFLTWNCKSIKMFVDDLKNDLEEVGEDEKKRRMATRKMERTICRRRDAAIKNFLLIKWLLEGRK